jgi:uncharacterized membrane protein YfcA
MGIKGVVLEGRRAFVVGVVSHNLAARVVSGSPQEFQQIIWAVAAIAIALGAYQAFVRPANRREKQDPKWFLLCLVWAVGSAILAGQLGFCMIIVPALPVLARLKD